MKKSYVVCVKSPSDWPGIHNLLLQDGTLDDNIPSRACECVDKKEVYLNKATYLLDEDEVTLVKNHPKVSYVSLDRHFHQDEADIPQRSEVVKVYKTGFVSLPAWNQPPRTDLSTLQSVVYSGSLELNISRFTYGTRPTIVAIHGGSDRHKGFIDGDKDAFDGNNGEGNKALYFNGLGYNYVSVDYRLVTNTNLTNNTSSSTVNTGSLNFTNSSWTSRNTGPQQVTDIINAISFLRSNAKTYGLDPDQFVLLGHGAGGYLATLVGTKKELLDAAQVPISAIKSVIAIDVVTFDISNYIPNIDNNSTEGVDWAYMNAWGVKPDINTVDFADNTTALAQWKAYSPIALINDSEANDSDFASEFFIITRGSSDNQEAGDALQLAIEGRGNKVNTVYYKDEESGGGTISGTVTYDYNGFHRVLGNDIKGDLDSAILTGSLGVFNLTTELKSYLESTGDAYPLKSDLNRANWARVRTTSREDPWIGFYEELETANKVDSINRNYYGEIRTLDVSHVEGAAGEDIDAVVIDNGCWHGHPEFVDENGVSQIKDLILDGPYYIDPDYFIDNDLITTYLGRQTALEEEALLWWSSRFYRSSSFFDVPEISGLSSSYTRKRMCGSFSEYPSLQKKTANNGTDFADHGTSVASAVYGKNFGHSPNANKWNVAQLMGTLGTNLGLPTTAKILEVLEVFHKYKPISSDSGEKRITLVNNSWGFTGKVAADTTTNWKQGTYYYSFRGVVNSFTIQNDDDPTPAPGFLKHFAADSRSRYSRETTDTDLTDSGNAFVKKDGVVWVCSAGNNNQKQVMPGEADYDNYWSTKNPTDSDFTTDDAFYVNRRGAPASFGYNSTTQKYKSFSIAALNNYTSSNIRETKSWYSNYGSAIDFLAPAGGVLLAAGNPTEEYAERYDDEEYYDWLDKKPFDTAISGTSTASPVAAGWIGSLISRAKTWVGENVKSYIDTLDTLKVTEFEYGNDPDTADDSEWGSYTNLFGSLPKVAYTQPIPSVFFTKNLERFSTANKDRSIEIGIEVLADDSVSTYKYQWEVSSNFLGPYEPIESENKPTLSIKYLEADQYKKFYRCKVTTNGAFLVTYSEVTEIIADFDEIILETDVPSELSVIKGFSAVLKVEAKGDPVLSTDEFKYEWQKLNIETDKFETIEGANQKTFIIENTVSEDTGFYRCRVSDPDKFIFSSIVDVIIFAPLLEWSQLPSNELIYAGEDVRFSAKAKTNSRQDIFYYWQESSDGVTKWNTIEGSRGQIEVINITNATFEDDKYYRVIALDNVSENSPLISSPVKLDVVPIELSVTSKPSLEYFTTEGEELLINIVASLSGPYEPSFRLEKKKTLEDKTFWDLYDTNSTGEFIIDPVPLDFDGEYRCIISDPTGNNDSVTISPINVNISKSFTLSGIKQSPTLAILDQEVILSPEIIINNSLITYSFLWERRKSAEYEWTFCENGQERSLSFVFTGNDFGDQFRCRVSNSLGNTEFTSIYTLNVNPFVDIVRDIQKNILFKQNSQVTNTLDPEVVSTHLSTVTYIWQKSLNYVLDSNGVQVPDTWEDITNETSKAIELTPEKILSLNSGNTDGFYFVRLKINFGQDGTHSFSRPTRIDLKDVPNLFGDCLSKEAADNLYNTDLIDSRKFHGNESLPDRQYLEPINVDSVDPTDKCKDKNTCGISIQELFDTYPIYNSQKGLYKTWGEIEFPWQLREALQVPQETCNLNNAETDDKWQISEYMALYAYFPKIEAGGLTTPQNATCLTERPADRVLRIEDDGYRVSLYEANQLITALSGPFDESKWNKICSVITSIPAGLPTPEEIKARYEEFNLDLFLEEWGEYNATWDEAFYQTSFDNCTASNATIADIEKCLKEKTGPQGTSDDRWSNARIKKEYFYNVGDYAWFEGECGDTVCLYINKTSIPATIENQELHKNFPKVIDGIEYWQKVYCVNTNMNKCLEPQRSRDLPNYQLVQLGSLGHYVEQPIPYFDLKGNKFCEEFETLNEVTEKVLPRVLTQEEIDALDQP